MANISVAEMTLLFLYVTHGYGVSTNFVMGQLSECRPGLASVLVESISTVNMRSAVQALLG